MDDRVEPEGAEERKGHSQSPGSGFEDEDEDNERQRKRQWGQGPGQKMFIERQNLWRHCPRLGRYCSHGG